MTRLGRRTRWAMLLRSFAVQGSWNYRTLLGTGFGFALLPALRVIYRDDPEALREAVQRHSRVFNSHPYLTPVALGAVAVLEAEGTDPVLVERFKTALRGSLGSVGDRLVWVGWRPLCLVGALALVLLGLPWWAVVAAFLLVYNAGHVALRLWGMRIALEDGRRVGQRLRRAGLDELQRRMATAGSFLIGFLLPLAAAGGVVRGEVPAPWIVAAVLGAALGIRVGTRLRTPALGVLVLFAFWGMLARVIE